MSGDWTETYTGRKFYPKEPARTNICINDIAHALSYQCRYNGHTRKFYSVAEHSVLLAREAKDLAYPTEFIMTALLHDAAEAYIGDLPGPIKDALPEFNWMEDQLNDRIARHFPIVYPFPHEIIELDNQIVHDERTMLMGRNENVWRSDSLEPLNVIIECWRPLLAQNRFLESYRLILDRMESGRWFRDLRHV